MTTPLTPTQVTDKNGRSTTVHKRLDARQSAPKPLNVPAPALSPASPVNAQQGTPLARPDMLSENEVKEFRDWHYEEMRFFRSQYNEKAREACVRPISVTTQALTWQAVKSGANPRIVIRLLNEYQLSNHMFRSKTSPASELHAQLRVATKIGKESPSLLTSDETIVNTLKGYSYDPKAEVLKPVTSIETEEELASITAVTMFILRARNDGLDSHIRRAELKVSNGTKETTDRMANKSLDSFLRENPHEIHRVLSYMDERPLGTTVKDTKMLIKHLAETDELGALGNGWL